MSCLLFARLDLLHRANPTDRFLSYVRDQHLDPAVIGRLAGIAAVTRIVNCGNRRFEFDDDHEDAVDGFVLEAFDTDGETVIDLVAWPLDRPDEPMTMFGRCGLLGAAAAMDTTSFIFDKPISIHKTPLHWLKAGYGAAVVDPRRAAWMLIEIPGRIAGQDREHTRKLLELAETVIDRSRFVAPAARRAA